MLTPRAYRVRRHPVLPEAKREEGLRKYGGEWGQGCHALVMIRATHHVTCLIHHSSYNMVRRCGVEITFFIALFEEKQAL